MKYKTVITIGLLVSAYFLQSCGNKNSDTTKNEMDHAMPDMKQSDSMDHGMMKSLDKGMSSMKKMNISGDFDLDFANMMIEHHQLAVELSEVEVTNGTDAQVKSIAQNITKAQKAEIEQLESFVKNHKPLTTTAENDGMNKLSKSMQDMMDTMHNLPLTGNTDKDFVVMMIAHHESAVKMAEDELKYGNQPVLKTMAQKVIADQSKEINDFKAWLVNQK